MPSQTLISLRGFGSSKGHKSKDILGDSATIPEIP